MSAGGFKFAKVSITGDSGAYSTVLDWCLAVHKVRCEAFLRATEKENEHWTPIRTGLTGETSTAVYYNDSTRENVYYTQVAPSTSYPAFVSYFRDTDTEAEYAILTGYGFTWGSSSTTCCYINPSRLNQMSGNQSGWHLAPSFMHAMAIKGFESYDITESNVADCELPFTSQYGNGDVLTSSTGNSGSSSMIANYTNGNYNGKVYGFGFAVKENVIESYYQLENGSPVWSIIGKIFASDCIGGNPYGVLCCPNNLNGDLNVSFSSQYWVDNIAALLCVSDYAGAFYPSKAIHDLAGSYLDARCLPSYNASRPNGTVPTNVYYGALCCGFNYSGSTTIAGLDSDLNLQKGYINTDILRVVSRRLCANAGSLFQNGNFVSMEGGTASSGQPLGILLGWDPSNDSLV